MKTQTEMNKNQKKTPSFFYQSEKLYINLLFILADLGLKTVKPLPESIFQQWVGDQHHRNVDTEFFSSIYQQLQDPYLDLMDDNFNSIDKAIKAVCFMDQLLNDRCESYIIDDNQKNKLRAEVVNYTNNLKNKCQFFIGNLKHKENTLLSETDILNYLNRITQYFKDEFEVFNMARYKACQTLQYFLEQEINDKESKTKLHDGITIKELCLRYLGIIQAKKGDKNKESLQEEKKDFSLFIRNLWESILSLSNIKKPNKEILKLKKLFLEIINFALTHGRNLIDESEREVISKNINIYFKKIVFNGLNNNIKKYKLSELKNHIMELHNSEVKTDKPDYLNYLLKLNGLLAIPGLELIGSQKKDMVRLIQDQQSLVIDLILSEENTKHILGFELSSEKKKIIINHTFNCIANKYTPVFENYFKHHGSSRSKTIIEKIGYLKGEIDAENIFRFITDINLQVQQIENKNKRPVLKRLLLTMQSEAFCQFSRINAIFKLPGYSKNLELLKQSIFNRINVKNISLLNEINKEIKMGGFFSRLRSYLSESYARERTYLSENIHTLVELFKQINSDNQFQISSYIQLIQVLGVSIQSLILRKSHSSLLKKLIAIQFQYLDLLFTNIKSPYYIKISEKNMNDLIYYCHDKNQESFFYNQITSIKNNILEDESEIIFLENIKKQKSDIQLEHCIINASKETLGRISRENLLRYKERKEVHFVEGDEILSRFYNELRMRLKNTIISATSAAGKFVQINQSNISERLGFLESASQKIPFTGASALICIVTGYIKEKDNEQRQETAENIACSYLEVNKIDSLVESIAREIILSMAPILNSETSAVDFNYHAFNCFDKICSVIMDRIIECCEKTPLHGGDLIQRLKDNIFKSKKKSGKLGLLKQTLPMKGKALVTSSLTIEDLFKHCGVYTVTEAGIEFYIPANSKKNKAHLYGFRPAKLEDTTKFLRYYPKDEEPHDQIDNKLNAFCRSVEKYEKKLRTVNLADGSEYNINSLIQQAATRPIGNSYVQASSTMKRHHRSNTPLNEFEELQYEIQELANLDIKQVKNLQMVSDKIDSIANRISQFHNSFNQNVSTLYELLQQVKLKIENREYLALPMSPPPPPTHQSSMPILN